jgi:hypothetical protein
MNPIVRPRYGRRTHPLGLEIEVEAPDWPHLLDAATLAVSDAVRPLGRFPTWTARRIAAAGASPPAVLSAWLEEMAALWTEGAFLPAFVEELKAPEGSALAILRGGCLDPADEPPEFPLASVPANEVRVTPAGGGAPWRARFVLAR